MLSHTGTYVHARTINYSGCFFNLHCIIDDAVNDDITSKESRHEVHLALEGGRVEFNN